MKKVSIVLTIILLFGILGTSHAELVTLVPNENAYDVDIRYLFEGVTLNAVFPEDPFFRPVYYVNGYKHGMGSDWLWPTQPALMVEFDNPTDFVSIDILGSTSTGSGDPGDIGWVRVYNSNQDLLEEIKTDPLFVTGFNWETVAISRQAPDISLAMFGGWFDSEVNLDNIVYNANAQIPIPGAVWLLGSGLIAMIGIRRKYKK